MCVCVCVCTGRCKWSTQKPRQCVSHLAVLAWYVSPSVLPEHAEMTQDEAGDHSGPMLKVPRRLSLKHSALHMQSIIVCVCVFVCAQYCTQHNNHTPPETPTHTHCNDVTVYLQRQRSTPFLSFITRPIFYNTELSHFLLCVCFCVCVCVCEKRQVYTKSVCEFMCSRGDD